LPKVNEKIVPNKQNRPPHVKDSPKIISPIKDFPKVVSSMKDSPKIIPQNAVKKTPVEKKSQLRFFLPYQK